MEQFKKALSEVSAIINSIPEELNNKISDKFKEIVELEKENEYKPELEELVIKNNLLPETIIILGMIHRDYLCSEEERKRLIEEEQEIIEKQYKENMENYIYENLFKSRKKKILDINKKRNEMLEEIDNKKEELRLIPIKSKWYEKVLDFFRNILIKK